jgi:hypothetical protein
MRKNSEAGFEKDTGFCTAGAKVKVREGKSINGYTLP